MASALTIMSSETAHQKALDALRSCGVEIHVEGPEPEWERIALQFPEGTMTLSSLIRHRPGDKFSKLVLSMHNFFRTVDTDAEANKREVLRRVETVKMMIGVVAVPAFSESDSRLGCLWRVVEAVDG